MRIAQLRKQKGITQTELAEACDTSQQQIAKIENGIVDPRVSTLRKIANALGCGIEELFFTRVEFLKEINSLIAEKHLNLKKTTLLELNHLCASERKLPTFHPFWEEIELKNGELKFKEETK